MSEIESEKIEALEAKISELDKRLYTDGKVINKLFTRVIFLDGEIVKQRTVNAALFSWFNDGEGTPIAALRESLK